MRMPERCEPPIDTVGLRQCAQAFESSLDPTVSLPLLYPKANGWVQAEWVFSGWDVSLEIALPEMLAQYHAKKRNTGVSRHIDLLLTKDSPDWSRLNSLLKSLDS
jgi:hypothetical protein